MKMQQNNSTNQLTKDYITQALVQLAKEKPFSTITITELSKRAGVSRMSFYRNFSSKEEVMTARLDYLIDMYRKETLDFAMEGKPCYSIDNLIVYFNYLKQHNDFLSTLFAIGFAEYFYTAIAEYVIQTWGDGTRQTELELYAWSGSLCSCYLPWAASGFKESVLEMATLLSNIYSGGKNYHAPTEIKKR